MSFRAAIFLCQQKNLIIRFTVLGHSTVTKEWTNATTKRNYNIDLVKLRVINGFVELTEKLCLKARLKKISYQTPRDAELLCVSP